MFIFLFAAIQISCGQATHSTNQSSTSAELPSVARPAEPAMPVIVAPAIPAETSSDSQLPTQLTAIKVSFSPTALSGNLGFASLTTLLRNGDTLELYHGGKTLPKNWQLSFSASSPADSVDQIILFSLRVPVAGAATIPGVCSGLVCRLDFANYFFQPTCGGKFSWGTYPTPGEYQLMAVYKDNTIRTVKFKMADPCNNVVVQSNNTYRKPSSESAGIKSKKRNSKNKTTIKTHPDKKHSQKKSQIGY